MSKNKLALQLLAASSLSAMVAQRYLELNKVIPSLKQENEIENILILGSGGVMGVAWHAATLTRLEAAGLWSPKEDDLRIGTSAGSMVAVALGAGFSPETILRVVTGEKVEHGQTHLQMPKFNGMPADSDKERANKWYALKTLSKLKMPYPGLFMSSLLPQGEESMDELINLVDTFTGKEWPEIETWVTSANTLTGRRHVFDKDSGVSPGFAVASSCAIPSLFKPLYTPNGGEYVDGGVISLLHIDLAMKLGAKKITVLAPLSGLVKIHPSDDPWNVSIKKLGRNAQEVALAKARVKAKARGIELNVFRPRPIENELLNRGSLMDSSLLPELVETTLKP